MVLKHLRIQSQIEKKAKNYWIYNFKTATFDNKSQQLKIYGCTMEKFDMNSETTVPLSSYTNINYSINFSSKISSMRDTIPY